MSSETDRSVVRLREARRAYRIFHTSCFWSYDPDHVVKMEDIPWIVDKLMKNGNRKAWEVAARLQR